MKNFNLFEKFTPKPVEKDDNYIKAPTNLKGFFVMLGRKFWNISNLNLVFVFCNFPAIFLFLGGPIKWLSLALIVTFPLSCIGSAHVIRSFNRAEGAFIYSDFFGAVKRNIKQGIVVGLADVLICAILLIDLMFWNTYPGFMGVLCYYGSLFMVLVYFFMRFYLYTILITFELPTFKIFKNSFIFAFLGFKRNFMALLGIAVVCGIIGFLSGVLLPLAISLCLVLVFALCNFISGYASYPVIKKYMIDPYYPDENDKYDQEAVFEDRG